MTRFGLLLCFLIIFNITWQLASDEGLHNYNKRRIFFRMKTKEFRFLRRCLDQGIPYKHFNRLMSKYMWLNTKINDSPYLRHMVQKHNLIHQQDLQKFILQHYINHFGLTFEQIDSGILVNDENRVFIFTILFETLHVLAQLLLFLGSRKNEIMQEVDFPNDLPNLTRYRVFALGLEFIWLANKQDAFREKAFVLYPYSKGYITMDEFLYILEISGFDYTDTYKLLNVVFNRDISKIPNITDHQRATMETFKVILLNRLASPRFGAEKYTSKCHEKRKFFLRAYFQEPLNPPRRPPVNMQDFEKVYYANLTQSRFWLKKQKVPHWVAEWDKTTPRPPRF